MKRNARQMVWCLLVFGIALTSSFAYLRAQETPEERRERIRPQSSRSVAAPVQRTQFQGSTARSSSADPAISDTPKPMLALTLWVVTLAQPAGHAEEDSKAKLKDLSDKLPPEFHSLNEVRDFIKSLKTAKRVRSSRELRMITLDGQSASVQVGSDLPQIQATSVTNRGRQNSLMYRSVGTMVDARPHIDSEKHIQVQLDYNMSDTAKSNDVALSEDNDGKSQFADVMIKRQFKTTVRLNNGSAVIAHCDTSTGSADKSGDGLTELIIVGGAIAGATN